MFKVLSRNKRELLLGNEAVVRGALEAGVQFVSTYPGTPASEIGNTFSEIQSSKFRIKNLYFEYSANEKVALEAGAGASFSGLKVLVAMKHFGLNVASDFLMPLVYTGIVGPLVLVVADDPGCSSSAQSEQNVRAFAYLAHIPVLEPASPQECKEFTKLAFEISEKYNIPVMVRETTRVALQTEPVKLQPLPRRARRKARFIKNKQKFVTMPPRVLEMKQELLEKIEKIRAKESKHFTVILSDSEESQGLGIITSGVSYLYVREALQDLGIDMLVLKLGMFYPLHQDKIKEFIKHLDKLLIVEELEPYLEREVRALAKDVNCGLEIHGKDLIPITGELKPGIVLQAIANIGGEKLKIDPQGHPEPCLPVRQGPAGAKDRKFQEEEHGILRGFAPQDDGLTVPSRHPQLCPGCPYWVVFAGIKQAVKEAGLKPKEVVYGGEIGCYMLAGMPPHNIQDYLYCMGSSVSIGHGISKSTEQKVISFVGDSSFFHAGIPALLNAVNNGSRPLVVIMENGITAMTGQQPHPGLSYTGMHEPAPKIKIEEIVKACGVKNVKVIDPKKNYKGFTSTVKNFLKKHELAVVIAQSPCVVAKRKHKL